MRLLKVLSAFLLIMVLSVACSVTYKAVMESQMIGEAKKMNKDKAYNVISSILIDEGFDIKMGNKDIGVITTEWKKYGGIDRNPPFDLYLTVKVKIKEVKGSSDKLEITLTPLSKDSNRLNSSAFTEKPLRFFDEEMQKHYLMSDEQVRLKGYLMYNNIVKKIAEALGLDIGDVKQNLQMHEESLFLDLK